MEHSDLNRAHAQSQPKITATIARILQATDVAGEALKEAKLGNTANRNLIQLVNATAELMAAAAKVATLVVWVLSDRAYRPPGS